MMSLRRMEPSCLLSTVPTAPFPHLGFLLQANPDIGFCNYSAEHHLRNAMLLVLASQTYAVFRVA